MSKLVDLTSGMDSTQERQWGELYDALASVLMPLGKDDGFGKGDFWLMDENWGIYQQKLDLQNLDLLKPDVVRRLQGVLVAYPDWDIVVSVDVPAHEHDWPPMGLIIRAKEIIDGLQRRYLPTEFRNLTYEGSRVGTDRD